MANPVRARDLASFVRPNSLRFKALMAVVFLIVGPLLWVWGTSLWDSVGRVKIQHDLNATSSFLARQLRSNTLNAEAMAKNNRLRIRLFKLDGTVLLDANHEGNQRWNDRFTTIFFGPEGRPDPTKVDAGRPTPMERPEIAAANNGTGYHCEISPNTNLLICAHALLVQTVDGHVWLHVQTSVARTTQTLYADRFQMLQLTLYVLILAVPFTIWLGIRWVRPLESLRDQALARTQGRVSTAPLVVDRNDEYGELADAFNTLLRAIEERNHANETFAADLAHELKNPIAAIQAAAEALAPGRPLTEKRAARLHRILTDSSKRMATVIDRFLELARAEAGLSNRPRESIDLRAMVNGILDGHRADPRFGELTFTLDATDEAQVTGTEERIETAIRNLINNAASFALPDGTVSLRIYAEDLDIAIDVMDSGPGISAEDLPKVFDRYFSKRQGGTGLGLALSRAIAQAHQGTLTVTSSPGSGATFTLRLPV